MTNHATEIARILLECEKSGTAPPYVHVENGGESKDIYKSEGAIVPVSSRGGDIFVVSDLHLAGGKGRDGRYDGCENFFSDASFRRFLNYAQQTSSPNKATLIINGDFIDFLRITYVPGRLGAMTRWARILTQLKLRRRSKRVLSLSPAEKADFDRDFVEWQRLLETIGLRFSIDELVESITDKEDLYGLKTHSFKSVLKLDVAVKGHQEFFDGLAEWLGSGNRMIIVKGNHDLEWLWLDVRNYLRLDLAQRVARKSGGDLKDVLLKTVLPNLIFIDHAMIIDEDFYIEHGHPYDALTRVIGKARVGGGEELNIPFGSFFNRYLLNYIELDHPFLDNIRPTPNILPLMLRQQFFTGLRLLYDHISVIAKTVPRMYVGWIFGQHIIGRVLLILLAVILPPILLLTHQLTNPPSWPLIVLEWVGALAGIYALVQALTYAQLKEPDSLAKFAKRRLDENSAYRLVTFGHTHNPDQFEERGRWFYNTGTWIPIVEATSAELREDKTFTFLHLSSDSAGRLQPGVLERWDDDGNRAEPVVLIRRATT
ncbi:MAG TPA: hypothetical protein VLM38_10575 [Blastocatellia bacterium]|nr:hypothetical protein [Blastocatellia bacterium]